MSLEQSLADVQARITAAERARIKAEHERDSAQAAATQLRAELQRDFGVSTAVEAEAKLIILRAELADIVEQLRAALDSAGV